MEVTPGAVGLTGGGAGHAAGTAHLLDELTGEKANAVETRAQVPCAVPHGRADKQRLSDSAHGPTHAPIECTQWPRPALTAPLTNRAGRRQNVVRVHRKRTSFAGGAGGVELKLRSKKPNCKTFAPQSPRCYDRWKLLNGCTQLLSQPPTHVPTPRPPVRALR